MFPAGAALKLLLDSIRDAWQRRGLVNLGSWLQRPRRSAGFIIDPTMSPFALCRGADRLNMWRSGSSCMTIRETGEIFISFCVKNHWLCLNRTSDAHEYPERHKYAFLLFFSFSTLDLKPKVNETNTTVNMSPVYLCVCVCCRSQPTLPVCILRNCSSSPSICR